jgi:hypothetical protein
MYEIEFLKKEDFPLLQEIWDSLILETENKNLFSLYNWQKNYWKYFNRGFSLFILLCKKNEKVKGIFPLILNKTKTLKFLGSGVSDYLDIICSKEEGEDVVNYFFNFLFSNSSYWNFIKLENIPEDSFLLKYENKNKEFIFFKTKTDSCPYIILPESYEEYLKSLGKKTRFNLNYYRRLLFRNFKTEFKVVQEKKELSNTLSKFFELHKKRWLKKGLPGMLYNKKRKEFHKEISNDLLEKNILRLYTLSLDGEIVGVLYGFLYSKKFYYYLSGFDPKFYKYSIGTVLTSYAIEKSIEEKAEIFDFLRGDEEYKYRFGCKNKFNYNLYIAKKEIKSLILFKKNKIQNKFENILKKAIR